MDRRAAFVTICGGVAIVLMGSVWMLMSRERRAGALPSPDRTRPGVDENEQLSIRRGVEAATGDGVSEPVRRLLASTTEELVGALLLSQDPLDYVEWQEREGSTFVSRAQFDRYHNLDALFNLLAGAGVSPPPDMHDAFIALRKGALAHGNGANMPIGLDASEPVVVRTRLASLAEPAFPASSEGRPVLAGRRWFVPRVTLEDLIRRDTHVPVATVTLPVRHVDNSLVRYHVLLYFDAKTSQWLIDGIGLTEFDEATTSGLDY